MQSNSMPITTSPTRKGKYHGPGRAADYVPRPPNAFMLYRSDFVKKGLIPSHVEAKQQTLSVLASQCWRRLDPEEQGIWIDLAEKIKREHSIKYPTFAYKPSPKRHIKPRRQSRTREQQIAAAEELMAQYLPDKAGPIPRNRVTTQSRKRRTYTKSHPPPPQSPRDSVTEKASEPHLFYQDDPVFMEPLLPPPSPRTSHPTSSHYPGTNQVEQSSMSTTAREEPAMADYPFVFYNVSQQEWQVESPSCSSNPSTQNSAEAIEHPESVINAAAHIREQYDRASLSEILPTDLSHVLAEESMIEPQPLLPPQTQNIHDQSLPPNPVFFSGPSFQQGSYQLLPSLVSDASAHSPASRYHSPSYPQPVEAFSFPISLDTHGHDKATHLQTPGLDSQSALPFDYTLCNTDMLDLSSNLDADNESFLFGEALDLLNLGGSEDASDWWTTSTGDLLQVNDFPTDV